MKKLLLSTLILNLGLIGSVNAINLRGQGNNPAVVQNQAQTNPTINNIRDRIKALQEGIKKNTDPISTRLQGLNDNITELTKDLATRTIDTLDVQSKSDINGILCALETEANDLWEKFGGSTFRWMYPAYQTKDLKDIKKALDNINDLNEKLNPMNVVTRYAYNKANELASFVNKNRTSSLLGAWLVYRLGRAAYNNNLYPSSETLGKVAGFAKSVIIG